MSKRKKKSLTYSSSGVDIDRANAAKKRIKELARSTFNESVVSDIGSFAGIFRPDFGSYRKPVLLSSADGVGTKLKIAFLTGIHHTVGLDIVSHCTNDILVLGAKPLFFLDYVATGTLDPEVVTQIVEGLTEGCRQSECVLLGGETAEMPDFYQPGEYDLAGFIVGIADEERLFSPERLQVGDRLIGLPSSGLHTNGFSLVRHLFFKQEKLTVDTHIEAFGRTLGEELLEPHRNYLKFVKTFLDQGKLQAIAHITGGGMTENLDRVLPPDCDALVEKGSWPVLPIFQEIEQRGRVQEKEMLRTFNMGIGMVLIVRPEQAAEVESELEQLGMSSYQMGSLVEGSGKVQYQ